jgi:hypothetical protein
MEAGLGDDAGGRAYADVLALDEAQRLLERGLEVGFLTQDEIVGALDDLDLDASAIDDVYRALELHQVDVVEGEDGAPAPEGTVAAAITSFHREWVEGQPVTVRRGYERALVLLARDLAGDAQPPLEAPLATLDGNRLRAHLQWRVAQGLDDRQELLRCGVHLHRLADWLDANAGTAIGVTRDELRAAAQAAVDAR